MKRLSYNILYYLCIKLYIMSKLRQPKEYSVKEYALLKGIAIPTVYKAMRENRLTFTKKFGVYIVLDYEN